MSKTPAPTGPRPQGVTLAATYLIVMGALLTLTGATCTLFQGALTAGTAGDQNDLMATIRNATFVTGVALLFLGVLSIGAGSGSLGARPWARWTGVFVSIVLAILLFLLGIASFSGQNGATAGVTTIVLAVLYALSAWALISARSWFESRE